MYTCLPTNICGIQRNVRVLANHADLTRAHLPGHIQVSISLFHHPPAQSSSGTNAGQRVPGRFLKLHYHETASRSATGPRATAWRAFTTATVRQQRAPRSVGLCLSSAPSRLVCVPPQGSAAQWLCSACGIVRLDGVFECWRNDKIRSMQN